MKIKFCYTASIPKKVRKYHWATNESGELLSKINRNALVTFIPNEWLSG